jgi:hypothetical protein
MFNASIVSRRSRDLEMHQPTIRRENTSRMTVPGLKPGEFLAVFDKKAIGMKLIFV